MEEFNNTISESNNNIADIIKKENSVIAEKNKEETRQEMYFMGDCVVKHSKGWSILNKQDYKH